jgi:hypothetical protein
VGDQHEGQSLLGSFQKTQFEFPMLRMTIAKMAEPRCFLASLVLLSVSACAKKEPEPSSASMPMNLMCMEAVVQAALQQPRGATNASFAKYGLLQAESSDIDALHPIRERLRKFVATWPVAFHDNAYDFLNRSVYWGNMLHAFAIEVMGPPPDFAPRDEAPSLHGFMRGAILAREELRKLFQDCHRRVVESGLDKEFLQMWQRHQFSRERIEDVRKAVAAYLRFETAAELPRFRVIYDPLMPPGTGANAEPPGGTVLLVGPWLSREKAEMNLAHEFLHRPLHAIASSDDVKAAIESSECAFKLVEKNWGYSEWQSYLLESLVRNISYRVPRHLEHKSGLVFEPFLAEELIAYESSGQSFEQFLPGLLLRLKAKHCSAEE